MQNTLWIWRTIRGKYICNYGTESRAKLDETVTDVWALNGLDYIKIYRKTILTAEAEALVTPFNTIHLTARAILLLMKVIIKQILIYQSQIQIQQPLRILMEELLQI